MVCQQAEVAWSDAGVPISTRFDDPYYSLENGPAETRHVFLEGNGLPERFIDGFHVAELGFGTGLNMLLTVAAWQAHGCEGRLLLTSFEAFPMAARDIEAALKPFDGIAALVATLLEAWQRGDRIISFRPDITMRVIEGDARQTLANWRDKADAWYLDGFSPAKNPELWTNDLMRLVFEKTRPGGTATTYSAAGSVRRGLASAGFEVDRIQGFGRKRHMTRASKPA